MGRSRLIRVLLPILGFALGTVSVAAIWWYVPPKGIDRWASDPIPTRWATWEWQHVPVETRYVPLAHISLDLQAAVIAGEDIGYFTHSGIDFGAVREALQEWVGGKGLRGASTITQQLARNLFLSPRRDPARKFREARVAHWMERRMGKRRILELYLNVVEFGDGLLGVGAAAHRYYGTTPDSLTRDEAAGLAACLPSPTKDNPATGTRSWRFRKETILARLRAYDWVQKRLLGLFSPEEAVRLESAARLHPDSLATVQARVGAWLDSVFTRATAPPDSGELIAHPIRLIGKAHPKRTGGR